MTLRRVVVVFVLAPVAAAALIALLLLVGVKPHLVFLPGFAVRHALESAGIHTHNRVGVLVTVAFWWLMIMIVSLVVQRYRGAIRR